MKLSRLIFVCFVLLFNKTKAQKTFSVTIHFPEGIDLKKTRFQYENGKNQLLPLTPRIKNQEVSLSGVFYSRYATLHLTHQEGQVFKIYRRFWVGETPAQIYISTENIENYVNEVKLQNAYALRTVGEANLQEFTFSEQQNVSDFLMQHNGNMTVTVFDSLTKLQNKLLKKRLQYIKNTSDSYYSLWFFRTDIISNRVGNPDSLMASYEDIFPDSLKKTSDGQQIVKYLNARRLKTNSDYIDFKAVDDVGKNITLSELKSKYVLLQVWASWCGPCMKEQPILKKIREQYPQSDVEIIGLNRDTDYLDFTKAVKKYDMNWIHIPYLNGQEIYSTYAIMALPTVFLMDTSTKKIIYKSGDIADENLTVLRQLLAEKLPQ